MPMISYAQNREDVILARAFADAFAGRLTWAELARELQRIAPAGTTEGSLFVPKGYASLPILQ